MSYTNTLPWGGGEETGLVSVIVRGNEEADARELGLEVQM